MSCHKVNSEFNLYYQNKHYSWADLEQQIGSLSPEPYSSHLVISAQQRFTTILYLLYGFINEQVVFPASPECIEETAINRCILPENSALAIATSGSQSKPKVAIISRHNIISHCQNFVRIIPMEVSSVWLNCMPLNHIAGVMIVYRCWFNNVSMLLHDDFDVQKIWDDIHHFAVTHISLVPRMLSRLLEYSQYSKLPENLKYVIVGGDKISEALFQRAVSAGWPIYISYGMTEATSTIAIGRTPDKLIPLDDFKIELNSDEVLKIKGPMVVSRVVSSVVLSVISDNADAKKEQCDTEWLLTNDRVKWDGKYLSVQGRNDDMIISGGNNIAPQYIESLLSSSVVIDDVAIGKICDSEWGDTIVALVCGDLDEFKIWVKKEIQSVYQPREFIKTVQIPRNLLGKINRNAVQIIINNYNKGELNGR